MKLLRTKFFSALVLSSLSLSAYATGCFITIAKDRCWDKYEVTVIAKNANGLSLVKTLSIPKGQPWVREKFECSPGETLAMEATFSPVFWAEDKSKLFPAKRYWSMPATLQDGAIGWNLTVCFPADFEDVPIPPELHTNCGCDLGAIPKI